MYREEYNQFYLVPCTEFPAKYRKPADRDTHSDMLAQLLQNRMRIEQPDDTGMYVCQLPLKSAAFGICIG